MTNIILASASPRRREILKQAGIDFKVVVSNYDEKLESLEFSKEKTEELAYLKCLDVAKRFPEDIVISADTVVVSDNIIFTKPKNLEHAKIMLKKLSGRTHFVQTTICLMYRGNKFIKSPKTNVTFNKLSDEMINYYVETYKPLDKAGAYGIQELPDGFVKSVDGDLENVIGISSKVVKDMLQNVNT